MALLEDGITWLRDTLQTTDGVTVSYVDGFGSVSLTAVPGQTPVELIDELGSVAQQSRFVDWLIDPVDLVIDGKTITPLKSHKITRTVSGTLRTYRVTEIPGGEVWRYVHDSQLMIRVHTLLVANDV